MPQKDVSDLTVNAFLKMTEPKPPTMPTVNGDALDLVRVFVLRRAQEIRERIGGLYAGLEKHCEGCPFANGISCDFTGGPKNCPRERT